MSRKIFLANVFIWFSFISAIVGADSDYIARARGYMEEGKPKSAAIELKNLLKTSPMDGDARLMLGEAYLKLGDAPAAIKELERTRDLHLPKERWSIPLAKAYRYAGKPQAVLDNFPPDASLPLATRARLQSLRGMAYISLGKIEPAEAAFNKTLELEPDAQDALLGLARTALSRRDFDNAVGHARRVLTKQPNSTGAWILLGESQRLAGKPAEALKAFGNAIKGRPDSVQARLGRATSNIAVGDYDLARNDVEYVRKTKGDLPLALYLNGLIGFQSKNLNEAEESLLLVVRAMPNHAPSHFLLGSIAYSKGKLESALSHLNTFTSAVPKHLMASKLLAATYMKLGRAEQAITALEGFQNSAAEDPQYLALLGSAYIKDRQFDKGTEHLTRAAELAPDAASIHAQLAMGHIAAGELDEAVGELENAVDLGQGLMQADVMLVLTRIRQKQYEQAIHAAKELAKKMPDNPVPENLLGAAYLARGDLDQAERHWAGALGIDPNYITAVVNLANLEIRRGNLDAAADRYKGILKDKPNHLGALLGLAKIAEQRKNYVDMRDWLEKARARNPDQIQPAAMLSRYHIMQGKPLKALTIANAIHMEHPDNPVAIQTLGHAQIAADKIADAVGSFRKLVQIAGNSPDSHVLLGKALYRNKDLNGAVQAFDAARKISPGYLPAAIAIGDVSLGQENFTKVFQMARDIQRDNPDVPDGFRLEGDAHLALERFSNAIQAYKKGNQLQQNSVLTMRLFKAHIAAGDYDSAFSFMEEWLRKSEKDAEAWTLLAMAYQKQGRTDKAITAYEFAHKLLPDNPVVANNLAWMYQETGDPRGVELAEKVLEKADSNPEILDTAGWILTQNGKAQRGLVLLQQAAIQSPHIPLIRYHLAQALVKTGQKQEARKELQRLLKENKAFPERGDAERLLTSL